MRTIIIGLLLCVILFLSACGNPSDQSTVEDPINPEKVTIPNVYEEAAMVIFTRQCIACHATDLSGRVGESSNIQDVGARLSKEQIESVIRNGKKIMPAQTNLTDAEVELMVNWLSLKK